MLRLLTKIIAWFCLLIGSTFLLTNGPAALSDMRFVSRATEVTVTVIGMDQEVKSTHSAHQNATMYRPTVSTTDANGAEVRYSSQNWYAPKPFDVGDVIPGRYDATSGVIMPDILRLNYGHTTLGGVLVPGLLAALSAVYLWRSRRRG